MHISTVDAVILAGMFLVTGLAFGSILSWRAAPGINRDGPEPTGRRDAVDRKAFEREVRRWD